MAAGDTYGYWLTQTTPTISIGGLAAGSAELSSEINNDTLHQYAWLSGKLRSGAAAPAVGTMYKFYLVAHDSHATTKYGIDGYDGTGGGGAFSIRDAIQIGQCTVTASATTDFPFMICTLRSLWWLPKRFGVVIENATNQALDPTDGNHILRCILAGPQYQTS